jgi:hypothetical protein
MNSPSGGWVESVLTLATHNFGFGRFMTGTLAVLAIRSFRLRTTILHLMFEVSLKPIARLYRDLLQAPPALQTDELLPARLRASCRTAIWPKAPA